MTVAVTGAAGFVGSHVVRALVTRGEDVIGIVRRMPDDPAPGVRYVMLDLADADGDTYQVLGSPDQLVHLAWGGLPNYLSLHHFERELPLQYSFLETMVRAGLPSVLVTGTCYEYGMVDGELVETLETKPANPYAFAKATLLHQLRFLQEEANFSLTWARLFYTWGDGQAPTSLYPLLQGAIARGEPSFPMSKGEQLRDYLAIADVAAMLAALASRREDDGIVNVCSGEPVSVRTLVERWIDDSGADIILDRGRYPYPTYEPLAFWGAAAKAHALLATVHSPSQ